MVQSIGVYIRELACLRYSQLVHTLESWLAYGQTTFQLYIID